MILISIGLVVGLLLSAFFSGSETGFYRVPRVRLELDAKAGSWIARSILMLLNRPSVVIATALIGNNLANYLVSFGLLLIGQTLLGGWGDSVQTMFPVLMTPFLFIYGELLPKYMFYKAPYFLLRKFGPLMIVFVVLFLPVSIVVMLIERILAKWLGQDPLKVGAFIEGQELQRVMLEGQQAGVLAAIQQEMSENVLTYGVRPVRQFAIPLRALPWVAPAADRVAILAQARRAQQPLVVVLDEAKQSALGYHLAIELLADAKATSAKFHPIVQVLATDTCIRVLTQLESARSLLAQIVDNRGRSIGLVTKRRLMTLLLTET